MTADQLNPAAARRILSGQLRQARDAAGITQEQAGKDLHWCPAKVQRIESGDVRVSRTDLRALLDLLGVRDHDDRARLEALAQTANREPWFGFHDVIGPATRRYLSSEGAASHLRACEPALIPELLWTESYAWSAITALALPGTDARTLRRRLDVWRARQAVHDGADRPQLWFVIDEMAIRRLISNTATADDPVVTGQIQKLHEAADNPHLALQILPASVGLHVGLSGGGFTLLTFTDADALLYRPDRMHPVDTNPDRVGVYEQVFADLAARASPPDLWIATLSRILASEARTAHHPR